MASAVPLYQFSSMRCCGGRTSTYSPSSRLRKVQPAARWRSRLSALYCVRTRIAAKAAVDAVGEGEVDDAVECRRRARPAWRGRGSAAPAACPCRRPGSSSERLARRHSCHRGQAVMMRDGRAGIKALAGDFLGGGGSGAVCCAASRRAARRKPAGLRRTGELTPRRSPLCSCLLRGLAIMKPNLLSALTIAALAFAGPIPRRRSAAETQHHPLPHGRHGLRRRRPVQPRHEEPHAEPRPHGERGHEAHVVLRGAGLHAVAGAGPHRLLRQARVAAAA